MGKGGLAFLQKKKWHPGTFKNIERTWAAQEEHEHQEKQKKLNVVKLKEERYLEGLKRLQVQEGLIPSSALDRMPWMYEFGNKVQDSKISEEFLTGRTITQADIQGQDQEEQQRFKAVVQEEKGNKVCEEFNRLHEDPLFLIKQEELKQQQQILSNPIQMKNIHEELKQQVKKHKKHGHKKHRHSKSRSISNEDKKAKKKEKKEKKLLHKLKKKEKKAQKKEEKNQEDNEYYSNYLKKRLGQNIVVKDKNGNVNLDFNYYKKKNNTSMITKKQLTQQQQLELVEQMKERAEQLRKDKIEQYEKDLQKSHHVEKQTSLHNPQFLQQTKKEIQKQNEEYDIAETMGRNRNKYIKHLDRHENTFIK